MKQVRKSNFELLRIIAMIMVVTLHFMHYSGILYNINGFNSNFLIANLIESFSIYAVDLYILISAYFLCDSKISIKKVITVWIQLLFYSVVIYVILSIGGIIEFHITWLIKSFLPLIFSQYTFVTAYIVLLFLSPYLNKLINSMNKDEYRKLVIILLIFFVILGILLPIHTVLSNYITTFITLYFIAAYIKKHLVNTIKNKYYFLLFFVCSLFIFTGRIGLYLIGKDDYAKILLSYNFILVVLGAVGLFIFFINIKVHSKTINNISALTFGVYLIHDNPYIRTILYTKILNIDIYHNNIWLILIICILGVFIISSIIEYLRSHLFEVFHINTYVFTIVDTISKLILITIKKLIITKFIKFIYAKLQR